MKNLILFIMVVSVMIPGLAVAKKKSNYSVVDVINGGTIKGTIKSSENLKDPVIPIDVRPKGNPKETELEKNTCGSSQQAGMYILSPVNEVRNALIIVEGIKEGKGAPQKDITIDNIKCKFEPLLSISYVGSNYINKNSDPIFHNANLAKEQRKGVRRAVYNLALPFKDQFIIKQNRVAGLLNIKCNAHPWMRAYVYSSEHPYAAITDERGSFEIKDLPRGKYKIRIWHEGFEDVIKEVEVKAGDVSIVNATFTTTRNPAFLVK